MPRLHRIAEALDPCRSDLSALAADPACAPKFGEPWHAQVFGLAMALAQAGVFTWATWAETFGAEIRRHPQGREETSEAAYYRQWSGSLIAILAATGRLTEADLAETAEAWRRSYLATEHGKPILFRRDLPAMDDIGDDDDDGHHHRHRHRRHHADIAVKPVSVSPAIG